MNDLPLYEKHSPQKNNYPLKLITGNSANGLHAHWHEHMELHLYLNGGNRLMCDNKTIEIEKNDIVFINRGQIHFGEVGVESKYYCIIINPEFFRDLEIKNVEIDNLIRNDLRAKSYVMEAFAEYFEQKEGWDMAVKGKVYNLMTYLFRNYKRDDSEEKVTKSDKKRMREIINYISTHYDEKLTTASLAEQFFVSEYYFCRYFKKNMGQTPVEYINRYRVEKAMTYLEDKEKSIREIAVLAGFDDQNYFSRVFKKFAGKSPVEYRNDI